MKLFEEKINWLNTHDDYAYSFIRIFLGITLFIRGIIMFSNPSAITDLIGGRELFFWYSIIMVAHIAGGLLLTIGFQTRFAAAIQIPILFGAVFFIHLGQGLVAEGQSLELSVLVMFLLLVYLFFGSGILALDNKKMNKQLSEEQLAS